MKRPFWLHQVAEYIIGLAAIATGFQSARPLMPTLMGGLILLNAAVADGPLSAFQWVKRRWHRIADWVVLLMMIVMTVLPGADLSARVVQVALVVVFAVVILGTNYTEVVKKREQRASEAGLAVDMGRQAGRLTGTLAARVRQRTQKMGDSRD